MAEHTPGPWQAVEDALTTVRVVAVRPGTQVIERDICEFHFGAKDEEEANARLIASAPDLLAALKGLTDFLSGHRSKSQVVALAREARAAIAKAEGRTSAA